MSASEREPARRAFAQEFNDATYTFEAGEGEFAPVYALLPTGARMNRIFIVGSLTETENVGDESDHWRGRVTDPTGTVFVYAGQYEPEAMGQLRELPVPTHVAVVGKPRTFETDEGETNVSLRAEQVTAVDEVQRRRWIAETAELTVERLRDRADGATDDAVRARDIYGEDASRYRDAVIEALEALEAEDPLEAAT